MSDGTFATEKCGTLDPSTGYLRKGNRYVHRMVLRDKLPPGDVHPCHWCAKPVTWGVDLQTDHIDFNRVNNAPENLVPSCARCNIARAAARRAAATTHCKRGHEFTPKNTYIIPSTGARKCLACNDKFQRAWQEKVRATRAARRAQQPAAPPVAERRRIREAAGYTQAEVARLVGVDALIVQKWEKGAGMLPHNAQRYRDVLDQLAGQPPRVKRCKNGHEMTEANTYRRPDTGAGMCRECNSARRLARTAAIPGQRRRPGRPVGTTKDTCAHGHPQTDENVYLRPDTGRRTCGVCRKLRNAARKGSPRATP